MESPSRSIFSLCSHYLTLHSLALIFFHLRFRDPSKCPYEYADQIICCKMFPLQIKTCPRHNLLSSTSYDISFNKTNSSVFQIYPDTAASMEVESSLVRCPHHKPGTTPSGATTPGGCRWVGAVNQLSGHLAVCRYDSLPCPKECGARLSRMCIADHLQYTCPSRRVVCSSCNKEFSGEAMEVSLDIRQFFL